MRVIITGGRTYDDAPTMEAALTDFGVTEIAHGGASGADRLAKYYGEAHGLAVTCFAADWNAHGRAAGPIRNAFMLRTFQPDAVMAFKGGRGTADMVRRAKEAGVRVIDVDFTEDGAA